MTLALRYLPLQPKAVRRLSWVDQRQSRRAEFGQKRAVGIGIYIVNNCSDYMCSWGHASYHSEIMRKQS